MDEDKKRRMFGILGRVCVGAGAVLLFFILLNMVFQTWVQVGPMYLPAVIADFALGFYFIKQSNSY